jgi:hypothetical protein
MPGVLLLESRMPRHLLTVWNPSYSASAMDQHLACLLGWVAKRDAKVKAEEGHGVISAS